MDILIAQQGMTNNEIKNQLNHLLDIMQKTGLFLYNHLASCSVTQEMGVAQVKSKVDKTALVLANLQMGDNIVKFDEFASSIGISKHSLSYHLYTLRSRGYIVTNGSKARVQPYCIKRLK